MNKRYEANGINIIRMSHTQIKAKEDLEKKMESREYLSENVPCECGASLKEDEILAEKDRYGLEVRNVICKKCGLIRITPRMNQEGYNRFYDTEYRRLYSNSESATEDFFLEQYRHGLEIYNYVKDEMKGESKKVLEIGCGAGGILMAFLDNGCIVKGIDLGSEYVKSGKEKDNRLDLEVASAKDIIGRGEKYDVIILSHVLEHMLNLKEELENISMLMKEDGILYIEVPGVKFIHKAYRGDLLLYMQNAHVYSFSMNTLNQIMKWNSYHTVKADERIRAIYRKADKKENVVENYSNEIMEYLCRLEKRRYLWALWCTMRDMLLKIDFVKKLVIK